MRIIDADKFLAYLIFSKHIDGLTCDEVKEAVEMSKVDVLDKIRAEISVLDDADYDYEGYYKAVTDALKIIDKYKGSEDKK